MASSEIKKSPAPESKKSPDSEKLKLEPLPHDAGDQPPDEIPVTPPSDSLVLTEGVLGVSLEELPADPAMLPLDQYPETFTASGASADTTIPSEMMNQYSSILTLSGYQYRI